MSSSFQVCTVLQIMFKDNFVSCQVASSMCSISNYFLNDNFVSFTLKKIG